MSSGLYSGVSGLALGAGLFRDVGGLWGGASGFVRGGGAPTPPGYYLEALPTTDTTGTAGVISQLYTNLTGTLVYSKVSGDARISINSSTGAISASAPVYLETPASFIAKVLDTVSGTYIEAPITLAGVVSNPFLLDSLSVAAPAAYSLRKLRGAYSGPAIRVRRSNDNAEVNIGFASDGGLDTAALLAHCGANTGFVTTWYDQSGNGRDLTQSTTSNQPSIVTAGVVNVLAGKPTITFDGTNDCLRRSTPFIYALGSAYITVAHGLQATTTGITEVFIAEGSTLVTPPIYTIFAAINGASPYSMSIRNDASTFMLNGTPIFAAAMDGNPTIISVADTGSSVTGYKNGVTGATTAYTRSGVLTMNIMSVGAQVRGSTAGYCKGPMTELVIAANDADRILCQASSASYLGISI